MKEEYTGFFIEFSRTVPLMEDNKKCTVPLWSVRLNRKLQPPDTNLFESMNLNQMFTPLTAMILSPFCDDWCLWIKCSISDHNNGLLRFFQYIGTFFRRQKLLKMFVKLCYMSDYGNSLLGSRKAWQQI